MFELSDWQRRAATQRFIDQALIGGRQRPAASGATFDAIDPASNRLLARVAACDAADVDAAVAAARRAFDEGPWARLAPVERKRVLLRLAELMLAHREELALLDSLNMGKPVMDAWNVDVPGAAGVFSWYAESLDKLYDQVAPTAQQALATITRVPLGVIGAVVPWNFPLDMAAWKLAPALAAGNAMIFKPSEVTPLTALKLAEIYTEAGVPDGVFNVLTGSGREVGQWLTEHPLIEKISFTGGTSTGKKVMASASSSSLKEVTMELGGKSPLIIFPDADLDRAADIAVMANFFSSGQVCTNGTRVFIHRSQQARFEAKVLERVQRIRLGDPQDENTNFGPLVSFPHMESVLGYIESGKAQKARLLCGGERVTDGAFGNGA